MKEKLAPAFLLAVAILFWATLEGSAAEYEEYDPAILPCLLDCKVTEADPICATDGKAFEIMSYSKLQCLQYCKAGFEEADMKQCEDSGSKSGEKL